MTAGRPGEPSCPLSAGGRAWRAYRSRNPRCC